MIVTRQRRRRWQRPSSESINYEHLCLTENGFTSWKRIKETFERSRLGSGARRGSCCECVFFLLSAQIARLLCSLCLPKWITSNGTTCKQQKRAPADSLHNNKWSDDVRWNLFTLFLLFFNFSLHSVAVCARVSLSRTGDNKMSINICAVVPGTCCGSLSLCSLQAPVTYVAGSVAGLLMWRNYGTASMGVFLFSVQNQTIETYLKFLSART